MNESGVSLTSQAADWAQAASTLPLAFSQVREDPQLDLHLVRSLPPAPHVVMIASGGETAIPLGREPLGSLHLVDMNPAQLALVRLKWELAKRPPEEAARILGHRPLDGDARRSALLPLLEQLSLAPAVFGPVDFVCACGPDHAGRYEQTFAALRRTLAPHALELQSILDSGDIDWAVRASSPLTEFGRALDTAFEEVMSLPNLVTLFGTEATQNPRQPFARHFAERTREALAQFPARTNPFLWQILAGRFPKGHYYDWLQPQLGAGTPCRVEPVYYCGRMSQVLDSLAAGSVDLVHLSNILDWLSPSLAEGTLASCARALKPHGKLIIRQLNSSLDIASLVSDFRWDLQQGASMVARDRSFFYPQIFVGERR